MEFNMITLKQMAKDAEKLGLVHFDCGRDCGNCGTRIRYVTSQGCVLCRKKSFEDWKKRNFEHYNSVRNRWLSENREYIRMYQKARQDAINNKKKELV
jgi:hypothetical protein